MVLLGQLLRRQFVQLHHLLGQLFRLLKALREQHDLGDQSVVRYHHTHRPEQDFQVIRKLCPPCIPRVHCDENRAVTLQIDVPLVEPECCVSS